MSASGNSKKDELIAMLEDMQDQIECQQEKIEELTKQNSGAQETISQLSSDNSKLKNELQKKSETVVSLNEQIGRMSEADLILKRNSELEMQNSEMNTFVRQIKKETDEKLERGKAELEARRRELEEREAFVTKKEMKLDTCIQIAADRAVKFRIIDLEKEYDRKAERLSNGYKTVKGAYLGCMIISMAFALITALWNIGHNEVFLTDLTEAGRTIWLAISNIGKGVWWLAVHAALLGDKIGIGWLSATVHWLLIILTIAAVVAGIGATMYFPIRKYIRFFLKKQADSITGAVALFTAATIIFMADPIKAVVQINIVSAWVILMILYTAGRGVMQMEDKEERRKVLIYAGAGVLILITGWLFFSLIVRNMNLLDSDLIALF